MSRYGYRGYYGYRNQGDQHGDRVVRAFEQSLRLLQCRYFPKAKKWELRVSSSTGCGYYQVEFTSDSANCSCPDFERRGRPCKHMLCVLLRILKLKNKEFKTVKEVGKSYDQITPAFLALFHHEDASSKPELEGCSSDERKRKFDDEGNEKVEEAEAGIEEPNNSTTAPTPSEPQTEEMCLICLLEFVPDDTMSKCSSHCKRWLGHKECLDSWFSKSKLCPLCKGPQACTKVHEPPNKRVKYSGVYAFGDVDIDSLQTRETGNIVDENAFFQIVQEE